MKYTNKHIPILVEKLGWSMHEALNCVGKYTRYMTLDEGTDIYTIAIKSISKDGITLLDETREYPFETLSPNGNILSLLKPRKTK